MFALVEILADLKEAILQIVRHFDAFDSKKVCKEFRGFSCSNNVERAINECRLSTFQGLEVDYSVESHGRDYQNFVNVAK